MVSRILVVDDEASVRKVLSAALRKEGHDVVTAQDATEALQVLDASLHAESGEPFHLVISDVRMPGMDGMQLLARIHKGFRDLPVIVLTAHGTVDLAVQALKAGAFDFLTKPYERDELMAVVHKALAHRDRGEREPTPEGPADNERALVGSSARMRHVIDVIDRVANSPSTVLITGESGTGKELVAHALHNQSNRRDKPFIRINVAAIPPTLLEAELFGHERGAFTGAVTQKPGRFELAHGGTLFLDEIGELQLDMQVKLLRVLQESTFERVGGVKTLHVDVRLIAATNRDLARSIQEGTFREDLFYRLNVVPIALPSLRERLEDLPSLAMALLRKLNRRLHRAVEGFTPEAMTILQRYPWPGNIRELENVIERTLLFCDHLVVEALDLPPDLVARVDLEQQRTAHHADATSSTMAVDMLDGSMKDIVRLATERLERDLIVKALDDTKGNVTHAARKLKISRKSLQMKMKELGLRDNDGDSEPPTATDTKA
jgi:two-component system, NtrC family, response regulator AtoC